jgi:hypothetical protein
MEVSYRPATLNERFFGHITLVKVPVSLPPENLPAPFAAPVDTIIPAPDLSLSDLNEPSSPNGLADFMTNHWGKILIGIVLAGGIYWYYKNEKEKMKKNISAKAAG